jgi:hypothetical protein
MRLAVVSGPLTGQLLDFSTSRDLTNSGTVLNGLSNALQLGAMFTAASGDGLNTTAGVANWGLAEIVWVRNNGAAVPNGSLVHLDKDFNLVLVPNTGLTGRPVFVTLTNFGVGSTIPQGGWVMRSGICPVLYAVAATVGPVYISATPGSATPTNPTGQKQIGNAHCLIPVATTFTRSVTVKNASSQVRLANQAGIFVGQTISTAGNTPIIASTEISALDPSGQFLTINNNTIASGTVTATFTMTGYGIIQIDRPFIMPAAN